MEEESVYLVKEIVGSSPNSWEDAVINALNTASLSLWDCRITEVTKLDVTLDKNGKIALYRAKIKVSIKYDNWKIEFGWKVPKGGSSQT